MHNESNSGIQYPPATILREKGLSVSIHVGTRKVSLNDVVLLLVLIQTFFTYTTIYLHTSYLSHSLLLSLLLIIKDGELCLCRVKPEETLVEARMRF